MTKVRVFETFLSYQGSGSLTGTRQFFIRFSGCSVSCQIRKICDEPGALKFGGKLISTSRLASIASMELHSGGWVQITGGEWKMSTIGEFILVYYCLDAMRADHALPKGVCWALLGLWLMHNSTWFWEVG